MKKPAKQIVKKFNKARKECKHFVATKKEGFFPLCTHESSPNPYYIVYGGFFPACRITECPYIIDKACKYFRNL